MFMDPAINPTTRAPGGAQCLRRLIYAIGDVSLLRSEENLFQLPFYKHYVPTG